MLTKKEFRDYVKSWIKFNKYMDDLYRLDVHVAENPAIEELSDRITAIQ